jgi:hypothetical protein
MNSALKQKLIQAKAARLQAEEHALFPDEVPAPRDLEEQWKEESEPPKPDDTEEIAKYTERRVRRETLATRMKEVRLEPSVQNRVKSELRKKNVGPA